MTQEGDDSLRLQAEGECPDTGVSSHTNRSVHAHQRARAQNIRCLAWHDVEHGSIFPSGPLPENPPKHSAFIPMLAKPVFYTQFTN